MDRRERIEARLREAFAPLALEVVDDSARHRAHAGSTGGGHYRVVLVSERFRGVPRVERHRMVYASLAEALREEIHALELDARTPEEASPTAPGAQQ